MAQKPNKKAPLKPYHRTLMPAQPRALHQHHVQQYNNHLHAGHTSFYDLPAELRIEIYRLALLTVKIHILPPNSSSTHSAPHPLVLTTRQVRNEVLPLIHNSCPIHATVTDFNFDGLLAWMSRMPPDQEANLCKNTNLRIELCTTSNTTQQQHEVQQKAQKPGTCNSMRNSGSLRKWLHLRADVYRPQPGWVYVGAKPDYKTMVDMRRRAKRAVRQGEKRELVGMLKAIGVEVPGEGV